MHMINFNGTLKEDSNFSLTNNSGFLYGDALFDTLILKNNTLVFFEAHYFRLVAGMRQLRMEIPSYFTQDYLESEIRKLVKENNLKSARVRTTVYRNNEGLIVPKSNTVNFLMHSSPLTYQTKAIYKLGIYKDNYLASTGISSIKTTNRIPNILAGIFAAENGFDNCVLLNHRKRLVEASNANIFIVHKKHIKTPALTEGCIDGIVRKKILGLINDLNTYEITEGTIDSFDLLKADEVFLTNSVMGIQAVTQFKRKKYTNELSKELSKKLESLID